MTDTSKLGKIINKLRLENNLSLRDLAKRSGVSYSFINSIEHDRFKGSRETIISLADALKGSDKNQLLLLAGFAPEDSSPDESNNDKPTTDNNYSIAFLGGPKEILDEEEAAHLERELEMFRLFREKRRKERGK